MGLTRDQRRVLLRGWHADASAAGQPLDAYLLTLARAALSGAETGEARLVASVSEAGQSVTYSTEASVPAADASRFLAEASECAAEARLELGPEATNDDLLACLLTRVGNPVRAFVKHFTSLRL